MKKDIPMKGKELRAALVKSGFSESEAGKYVFHGWRHFYTTYLMGKLEKKLLKPQTGHLTDSMLAHYGEHQTESDRKTIQVTAVKAFGGLIPSGQLKLRRRNVTK